MRTAFVTTTFLILGFLSWVWLAPTTVRGSTTYTIISGSSMEPNIHRGDLALIKAAKTFRVGDVAAYNSTTGRHVLHRIVAEEDGRYVFQGDNNGWLDSDRPTQDLIVGRLWMRIPRVGDPMRWMQVPWHAALLAGGVAMVTGGGMVQPPRRKWPRRFFHRPDDSRLTMLLLAAAGAPGRVVIGVALAIAAVALTLVAGAFLVSPFKTLPTRGAYEHQGEFSYYAQSVVPAPEQMATLHDDPADAQRMVAALQDPVFRAIAEVPSVTGQPLLSMVNPNFDVAFQYRFESGAVQNLAGSIILTAEVRDVTGWTRTFPMTPKADFAGDHIQVSVANLSLQSFMRTVQLYEVVTGHTPRYYTASLLADVEVRGTVDGRPFTDRFQPKMVMRIVPPSETFPETEETRAFELPGAQTGIVATDPFRPHKSGEVTLSGWERRTVTMLGVTADIHTVRWASLGLLAAALSVVGIVLWLMALAGERGEAFAIRARYGPSLVLVDPADEGHSQTTVIRVSAMDDLMRLAHHSGGPVLVELRGGRQLYMVREGEHFYAYEGEPEYPKKSS